MNSDTLDLGGERRGRRVGGAVGAVGCPLQPACKGRGIARVYRYAQPYALQYFQVCGHRGSLLVPPRPYLL
jgi:hypothetical protein